MNYSMSELFTCGLKQRGGSRLSRILEFGWASGVEVVGGHRHGVQSSGSQLRCRGCMAGDYDRIDQRPSGLKNTYPADVNYSGCIHRFIIRYMGLSDGPSVVRRNADQPKASNAGDAELLGQFRSLIGKSRLRYGG